MKKIVGFFIVILFSSVFFTSCNQASVEEQIIGKWTINSAEFLDLDALMDQISQAGKLKGSDVNQVKQGMVADLQKDYQGATIEFNKDHSVILSGSTEPSTWEYDKTNDKIIIKESNVLAVDFIVEKIDEKKLSALMKMSQNGFDFQIKMKLEKD